VGDRRRGRRARGQREPHARRRAHAAGAQAARGAAPVNEPINVAGVKLTPTGRTLACDAGTLSLRPGERVVIEDERGPELATVAVASAPRAMTTTTGTLPRVLRVADARDLARAEANERRAAEALAQARERARERGLPMKLFRAEFHHGGA